MREIDRSYYVSLYKVMTIITSARSPEDILNALVENVAQYMKAKGCALILLTGDRKLLLHTVHYGLGDEYIKKGPLTVDEGLREALEGKPMVISDVMND